MLNGQRSDCVVHYFFLEQQACTFISFFWYPHITVTGSLGNTLPRISCQQVSGLESTKWRPQSLKEETVILRPVRRPHDLQEM